MLQRFTRGPWLAALMLAGLIGLARQAQAATTVTLNSGVWTIDNGHIAVSVTLAGGAWSAKLDGVSLFTNMTGVVSGGHSTSSGFASSTNSAVIDGVGTGRKMVMTGVTAGNTLTITEYDNEYFFLVDWTDSSAGSSMAYSGRFLSGAPSNIAVWYHDTGYWNREYRPITKRIGTTGTQSSQFAIAGWDGDTRPGLLVGSVGADARGQLTSITGSTANGGMNFTGSTNLDGNRKAQTFAFFAAPANTPSKHLTLMIERYGQLIRILNNIQLNSWTPAGWCSWDSYGDSVTEAQILSASNSMVSTGLKDFGMTLIQIDDGWQKGWRCSGDWQPNTKFAPPTGHGMKYIADYIHGLGLTAGLWVGPFVDEDNPDWRPVYNGYQHPEFGGVPVSGSGPQNYVLSDPDFLAWIGGTLTATITQTGTVGGQQAWGFDYVKTDFLYGGNGTDLQYRAAMQAMKAGMRAGTYLLHCNGKQFMGLGVGDGMRTGDDVGVTFNYFGGNNSVRPTIESSAFQWYANRNLWINDSDQVHVTNPLTDAEARTWATLVGLSGGVVITGDKFWDTTQVPANRLDMLKRISPAYGVAARPADMFENAQTTNTTVAYFPNIYVLPITKPWGTSYVVAVYNWDSSAASKTVNFVSRFGASAGQAFAAYEFWSASYLGTFTGSMTLNSIPSHDVKCLVFVPVPSTPLVISTNRHITNGGLDLVSQSYDANAHKLSGTSQNVVKNIPYTLVMYRPAGFTVTSAKIDGTAATVTNNADGATRISGTTTSTTSPTWEINFAAPPTVAGRYVFYNNSKWDGQTLVAAPGDAVAIATDKVALLPGGTGAFANITSFSRGINGIIVDISGMTGTPTTADIGVKVGNTNPPTWSAGPVPTQVLVLANTPVSGTGRVIITFADNAIQNTWLQLTVKAGAGTGLATDDVFCFGNLIGASGASITSTLLKVTATDEINCRNNPRTAMNPATITDIYDYNRDQRVNATDQIISRNNVTGDVNALNLITLPAPSAPAAAPVPGGHKSRIQPPSR